MTWWLAVLLGCQWLNTDAVIQALHVSAAMPYIGQWDICSGKIWYTQNEPNLPRDVYPTLVLKYKVLVYNGDVDACVPVRRMAHIKWIPGVLICAGVFAVWIIASGASSLPSFLWLSRWCSTTTTSSGRAA